MSSIVNNVKAILKCVKEIHAAVICDLVTGCILMEAWDFDNGLLQAGETSFLEIKVDGVSQTIIAHDYTTTYDGTNKSTWYTPWVAAINALPEWSMTLVSDTNGTTGSGKPEWRIDYSGSGGAVLTLCKSASAPTAGGTNQEKLEITADATGALTGVALDFGGSPIPSTLFAACT